MKFDKLSELTIGCAIEVHRVLGPGLLESTYERCLAHELGLAGLRHKTQYPLPVEYKGVHLDCGYRIDVLVEDSLIVELKAVEALEPIHEAQLLTYLRLSGRHVGLLINFHVPILKQGLRRMVL
ncbi:MAG TPA: GxxExxY protein [Verrucomicrobiota bacterium]|nr:GxxExxY protein [Verrucomicrobiota bacterium]